MDRQLTISEIFGPTIQGEGPLAGRRASFVRFGLCNLDCANCDTAYTWDWSRYDRSKELHAVPVDEVVASVMRHRTDLIVVTGGEPMVQRLGLLDLAARLFELGKLVQVETNGTLGVPGDDPIASTIRWVVSPKMAAMPTTKPGVRLATLQGYAEIGADLKVVCATVEDVDVAAELARTLDWPADRVWIMPEGTDAETLDARLADLADHVIEWGFNLTTRLHVHAWGNRRGR